MTLQERMRELRKERKETQRQVADAIGVTDRQYQRFETGVNLPGFEKVPKTYIAAYEAVETASVPTLLRSVPSNQSNEYIPTTNITLNLMQAYARGRNRSKHWNVYTY